MGGKNRRNYYRLLHVQQDAPTEVIKASYRTLMLRLKNHPDLGGDGWNAALINEAYAVLSNPELRERYDLERGVPDSQTERTSAEAARARPAEPPPGPQSAPAGRQESADPGRCAFCQTDNSSSPRREHELCRGCGAPLRLVDLTAVDSSERATGRIEHETDISYRVDPSSSESTAGQVVDLSPTGLRFLSRQQLIPGCVIKLDTPTLSAVARVTRSQAANAAGVFSTGVQFLTLQLGRPRGTFVSESA